MDLIQEILEIPHIPNTFNPYTDKCFEHDSFNGTLIRLDNLEKYFRWIEKHQPDDIIIGEAYGWRGGRRTGLPFTDDEKFDDFSSLYVGMEKLEKATNNNKRIIEQSAESVWGVFRQLQNPPAMWNLVPLHPHEAGQPLTNKKPTMAIYNATNRYTAKLIEHFEFKRVFGIGRVATDTLGKKENINISYIRHPSYGGKPEFIEGMFENFGQILS